MLTDSSAQQGLAPQPAPRHPSTPQQRNCSPDVPSPHGSEGSAQELLHTLRTEQIGNRVAIATPFGEKPLIYADHTASGRALRFLENNMMEHVLSSYANTHSETSFTGARTDALREAARMAIRQSVGGTENDKVIFCGSGATAAINRLIDILGLRISRELDERFGLSARIPDDARPVVLVGPYEHHSNELPWRETICHVERIPLDPEGRISQEHLVRALHTHRHRPQIIGSFSAASNVTGIRSDVEGITRLLKDAGALSFWDYAAAGPYVPIDMNPAGAPIDAVFLSPHKFLGGPGTPGVLVAKAHLCKNPVPAVVGGGTVSYVSPSDHRYLSSIERREEGGTPAIVESIRAGAVFAIKDKLGTDLIESIEDDLVARAFAFLTPATNIEILGSPTLRRLGIFSMRFKHGDKDLHHGFVATLLNDLFGIQARGGCSCAGPYGHDLLGIDLPMSKALDAIIERGYASFKPGWLRVNFHYAAEPEEIDYMLRALQLVSDHAWKLLPSYVLDHGTGTWRHRETPTEQAASLDGLIRPDARRPACSALDNAAMQTALSQAVAILHAGSPDEHIALAALEQTVPAATDKHRWFLTPAEAAAGMSVAA